MSEDVIEEGCGAELEPLEEDEYPHENCDDLCTMAQPFEV